MDVIARLDRARRRTNVLEHPFYERWSAGDLSAAELDLYAGEYRHAVLALACASAQVAQAAQPEHRPGLLRHAAEEASHVALWDQFARAAARDAADTHRAAGIPRAADAPQGLGETRTEVEPNTLRGTDEHLSVPAASIQTQACAQAWTAGSNVLEQLAVLYAIEASQPEISRTKLQGLVGHYGYTPEGPAVEYFELHAHLDVEHARQAGELIEELLARQPDAQTLVDGMLTRAQDALRGNWELLDGVEALAAAAG